MLKSVKVLQSRKYGDGQGLDYEYFALVKGGPDEANAKKALAMMTNTEMLAGSAKSVSYTHLTLPTTSFV